LGKDGGVDLRELLLMEMEHANSTQIGDDLEEGFRRHIDTFCALAFYLLAQVFWILEPSLY